MYSKPQLLTGEQADALLVACVVDAAHSAIDSFNCAWGAFLIGMAR